MVVCTESFPLLLVILISDLKYSAIQEQKGPLTRYFQPQTLIARTSTRRLKGKKKKKRIEITEIKKRIGKKGQ